MRINPIKPSRRRTIIEPKGGVERFFVITADGDRIDVKRTFDEKGKTLHYSLKDEGGMLYGRFGMDVRTTDHIRRVKVTRLIENRVQRRTR